MKNYPNVVEHVALIGVGPQRNLIKSGRAQRHGISVHHLIQKDMISIKIDT